MNGAWPTFVVAGPNKSASTWIYAALSEHPDVCMASDDPVSYFDVQHYRGPEWYRSQFEHWNGESAVGDESPGYIKSLHAPERISEHNPDAKIVFCFRNPMERAYSQWWHGRTRWHQSSFRAGILDHERFDYWVAPGFYARHLRRWDRYFSPEQLYLGFFDDFVEDNEAFIRDIYEFIGVDPDFRPSVIGEKLNVARTNVPDGVQRVTGTVTRWVGSVAPRALKDRVLRPLYRMVARASYWTWSMAGSRREYRVGMEEDVRRALEAMYAEDVRSLQRRTGRDLSDWFEHSKVGAPERSLGARSEEP